MQGGNSSIDYFDKYIVKTITSDDGYGQPLNVAAAREVYLMQLARAGYNKIPKFISLSNNSITMERVQGTRLEEYLELADSIDVYRLITSKMMNIVMIMINAGVVHRDLSYENILIDKDDNLWIIDFGFAKAICAGDDNNKLYNEEISYYLTILNQYLRAYGMDHLIPPEYNTF